MKLQLYKLESSAFVFDSLAYKNIFVENIMGHRSRTQAIQIYPNIHTM